MSSEQKQSAMAWLNKKIKHCHSNRQGGGSGRKSLSGSTSTSTISASCRKSTSRSRSKSPVSGREVDVEGSLPTTNNNGNGLRQPHHQVHAVQQRQRRHHHHNDDDGIPMVPTTTSSVSDQHHSLDFRGSGTTDQREKGDIVDHDYNNDDASTIVACHDEEEQDVPVPTTTDSNKLHHPDVRIEPSITHATYTNHDNEGRTRHQHYERSQQPRESSANEQQQQHREQQQQQQHREQQEDRNRNRTHYQQNILEQQQVPVPVEQSVHDHHNRLRMQQQSKNENLVAAKTNKRRHDDTSDGDRKDAHTHNNNSNNILENYQATIRTLEQKLREQTSTFQIVQQALLETQKVLQDTRHENIVLQAKCAKAEAERDGVQAKQAMLKAQNAQLTHEKSTIQANYKKWYAEIETKFVPQMKKLAKQQNATTKTPKNYPPPQMQQQTLQFPSTPKMNNMPFSGNDSTLKRTHQASSNSDNNANNHHPVSENALSRRSNTMQKATNQLDELSNDVVMKNQRYTTTTNVMPQTRVASKASPPQVDPAATAYTPKTTTVMKSPPEASADSASKKHPPTRTTTAADSYLPNTVTPSPWTGTSTKTAHRQSEQKEEAAAFKATLHTPATTNPSTVANSATGIETTTPRTMLLNRLERTNDQQFSPQNTNQSSEKQQVQLHRVQREEVAPPPPLAVVRTYNCNKENLDPTADNGQKNATRKRQQQEEQQYLQSRDNMDRPQTKPLQDILNMDGGRVASRTSSSPLRGTSDHKMQQQVHEKGASTLSAEASNKAARQHIVQQKQKSMGDDRDNHKMKKNHHFSSTNNDDSPDLDKSLTDAPFSQIEVEPMSETQLDDIYHLTQDPALKDPESQQETDDLRLQHYQHTSMDRYGKQNQQKQEQSRQHHSSPQVPSPPSSASTPDQDETRRVTIKLPIQERSQGALQASNGGSPETHLDESQTQVDQSLPLLSQYSLRNDQPVTNKVTVGFNVRENIDKKITSITEVGQRVQHKYNGAHAQRSLSMTEQRPTKKVKVDTKSNNSTSRHKSLRSSISDFQDRVLSSAAGATTSMTLAEPTIAQPNNNDEIRPDSIASVNNKKVLQSVQADVQFATTNNNSSWTSAELEKKQNSQKELALKQRPKNDILYCQIANDNETTNDKNARGSDVYRYQEVVRNKAERQALPARTCPECDAFLDVVCNVPGGNVFNRQHLHNCSRHRSRHTPPQTPDDFWELSFADSIKNRTDKTDEQEI